MQNIMQHINKIKCFQKKREENISHHSVIFFFSTFSFCSYGSTRFVTKCIIIINLIPNKVTTNFMIADIAICTILIGYL